MDGEREKLSLLLKHWSFDLRVVFTIIWCSSSERYKKYIIMESYTIGMHDRIHHRSLDLLPPYALESESVRIYVRDTTQVPSISRAAAWLHHWPCNSHKFSHTTTTDRADDATFILEISQRSFDEINRLLISRLILSLLDIARSQRKFIRRKQKAEKFYKNILLFSTRSWDD